MLARKNLLSLRKEFPRLHREGQTYSSDSFGLIVSYGSSGIPQAAFLVSKKVSPKSVIRHQVKRKVAAVLQPLLPRLPQNLELVFLVKPKAVECNQNELKIEVQSVLERARLISPSRL